MGGHCLAAGSDNPLSLFWRKSLVDSFASVTHGIAGIGTRTAAALLALIPELGPVTEKKAASLAGCSSSTAERADDEETANRFAGRTNLMPRLPHVRSAAGSAGRNPV